MILYSSKDRSQKIRCMVTGWGFPRIRRRMNPIPNSNKVRRMGIKVYNWVTFVLPHMGHTIIPVSTSSWEASSQR